MEKEITVIEAYELIQQGGLQLLDVRNTPEFEQANLEGFINIPLADLSQAIPKLDGKKRTLLLCQDGNKSHQALQLLEACGYKASVIRGGMQDWKNVIG